MALRIDTPIAPTSDVSTPVADQQQAILVAQTGQEEASAPSELREVVIEISEGSILRLPEGASIDQPRMNGTNLEFVQPDGSVVVVPNGAIQGLTIFIGGIEIPPIAVAALFEESNIQTAAGPEGNSVSSSGGNFERPVGDIGDAFQYGGLLDDAAAAGLGDGNGIEAADANLAPILEEEIYEVRLTEEALENGFPDDLGTFDFSSVREFSGSLGAFDPNNDAMSFTFGQPTTALTSGGIAVTWTGQGTGTLTGWAGDVKVFEATFTGPAGEYTITLYKPVDHTGAGEDELAINLPITVTDIPGGMSTPATIRLIIEDDSPVVRLAPDSGEGATRLSIAVDETVGADRAAPGESANGNSDDAEGMLGRTTSSFVGGLADLFTLTGGYGADGAAATNPLTISFSFTGIPAGGLVTNLSATNGGPITLFLENGAIVGRDAGNEVALRLEIVGAPGAEQIQTTLFKAIAHGSSEQFDETAFLRVLQGAAQLRMDVAATDFDGDTASTFATIDLANGETSVIGFEDDGPVLSAIGSGSVSESTQSGSSNGFIAASLTDVALNVNWGADGIGKLEFTTSAGASGLTSNGQAINYYLNGDGTVLTAWAGGSNGRVVFEVTLDADAAGGKGSYSFVLKGNIDHAPGSDVQSLSFGFKATDGDGDFATGSFVVNIQDDAPVIGTTETEYVSEQNLPFFLDEFNPDGSNSLVQPGNLAIDWNSDDNNSGSANRSVAFVGGLAAPAGLTADGHAVSYSFNAARTVLTASANGETVFTVTLSDSGSGSYTFRLYGNLDHAVGSDDLGLNFGFVAKDADGDTATGSFAVHVADDVLRVLGTSTGYVEEEALSEGNNDVVPLGVEIEGTIANLLLGKVGIDEEIGGSLKIDWGNDSGNSAVNGGYTGTQVMGDRSVVFSDTPVTSAAPLSSGGQPLQYTLSANGTVLTAWAGNASNVVFRVTLSDQNAGSYKFELVGTLDHPVKASGASLEDVLSLQFNFVARDGDGDQASGNFTVKVIDDAVTLSAIGSGSVSESTQSGSSNGFIAASLTDVALNVNWGADGIGKLEFTTSAGASGLTSNGQAINYYLNGDGTVLTAWAGGSNGRVVFEVTLDADAAGGKGSYSFVLKGNIDHAPGSDVQSLSFGFKATDGDGDFATGSFVVNIQDDAPVIGTTETEYVSEQNLPFFLDEFNPDGSSSLVQPGNLAIDWNSDDNNSGSANRSVAFVGGLAAPAGLTADGHAVSYSFNAARTVLTASANGETVFTVTLSDSGSGSYTFRLYGNLDHAVGSDDLGLNFGFVAKDADGDTATGSFAVHVADDVLRVLGTSTGYVEEEALSEGNNDVVPLGVEIEGTIANLLLGKVGIDEEIGGSLKIDWGNDSGNSAVNGGYTGTQVMGDRSVVFSDTPVTSAAPLSSGGQPLQYTLSANGTVLTAWAGNASNVVFRVTLSDQNAGSYKFELVGTLDHPVKASGASLEDVLSLQFNFVARDGDGDQASGNFTVKVIDDAVTLSAIGSGSVSESTQSGSSNGFIAASLTDVALNVNWGADGIGKVEFTTSAGASGLTSNGQAINYYLNGDGTVLTARAGGSNGRVVFEVTLDADAAGGKGSYSFVLKDNIDHAPGSDVQSLSFGFKATDGDGDFATGSFVVNIQDDAPVIGTTETEYVSEQNLPFFLDEFNPDGSNSLVQPGNLAIDWNSDDNNSGSANRSVAFVGGLAAPAGLTADGHAVSYSFNAARTVLTASANGETVFTVTLSDSGSGSYTFRLYGNLDHAVGSDDLGLNFGFVAKDADGDTATGSFAVHVADDVLRVLGTSTGYVEEEALSEGNNDVVPLGVEIEGTIANLLLGKVGIDEEIGGSLKIDWGNDSGNSAVNGGYTGTQVMGDRSVVFSDTPVTSAAPLSSGGQPLQYTLSANGTVLTAWAGNASNVVFRVTLSDQNAGSYKFELVGTLDHPVKASGASLEDVLSLQFNFVARDGDGDQASGNFTVKVIDDAVTLSAIGSGSVSESTQSGSSNGFIAASLTDVALNVNWGADGIGKVEFTTSAGASGLTSNGQAINYYLNGDGTVLTARAGGSNGRVVFEVTLDADAAGGKGSYSFVLKDNIDHAPGSDVQSLSFGFKATDGDGDFATGSFVVNIQDDAPVIGTTETEYVSEQNLPFFLDEFNPDGSNSLVQPGNLAIDWNSDDNNSGSANRSVAFVGGLAAPAGLTADGHAVSYSFNAARTVLTASANGETVFTVTLSDSGSGSYTFRLYGNLDHAVGSDDLGLNFGFVAKDADGDTATGSFAVHVADDVLRVLGTSTGYVEEEALSEGNNDVVPLGVEIEGTIANLLLGKVGIDEEIGGSLKIDWGNDSGNSAVNGGYTGTQVMGDRSVVFSDTPVTSAAPLSSGGQPLQYTLSANGTVLTAWAGNASNVVFRVTLSDQNAGSYKFELVGTLDHPVKASGASLEDVLSLQFNFVARDGDGDQASGNFTVKVIDDAPLVSTNTVVQLDDDGLLNAVAAATGTLGHDFGADGEGTVSWLSSGMTLGNSGLGYRYVSATELIITQEQGGQLVDVVQLTITDQATGAYSIKQLSAVDHPDGGSEDNIQFTVSYEVRDGDGDTSTGAITVDIDDDVPTAGGSTTVWLDDETLPGGIPGGDGDHAAPLNLTGTLNHSFGADKAGASISWLESSVSHTANLGITFHAEDGGKVLMVRQNGVDVIKATLVPGTGAYSIEHLAPIKHPAGADENDLTLQLFYEVTDGDGDTAKGYLWVKVDDDTPTAGGSTTVWLDDETLPGGIPGGDGDHAAPLNLTGTLNHSFGADKAGASISWLESSVSHTANLGITFHAEDGGKVLMVRQNGVDVIKATLVPGTGAYSIEHLAPIKHPAGADENDLTLQLFYEVTDGDGDTAKGHLWVKVDDDTPTAGGSTTVWLDDETLPGGIPGGDGDHAAPLNLTGTLNHSFGADKAGASISWLESSVSHTANLGITFHAEDGGKVLMVRQNGVDVIKATLVPGTGAYTVEHLAPIKHPAGADENDLTLQLFYEVTDGDGDTAKGHLWVKIDDDTPVLTTEGADVGTLSEVDLPQVSSTFGDLGVAIGADKNGHVAFAPGAIVALQAQGLTSDNVPLEYTIRDNGLGGEKLVAYKTGSTADDPVFIIGVYRPANFAATLFQNVDHATDSDSLLLNLTARVYDGDGDYVDRAFTITVADDAPTLSALAEDYNLLTNGDFSAGAWSPTSYGGSSVGAVGWSINGTQPGQTGVQLEQVANGYMGMSSSSGRMVDLAASPGNIEISQTLSGLNPSSTYTLSFEIGSPDPSSAGLEVYWNGVKLNAVFTITNQMTLVTLNGLEPDSMGRGVLTFKEVGSPDNTGTYLADVKLAPTAAPDLPLVEAQMGEDGTAVFNFNEGTDFDFGADGKGSVAFDANAAVISTPSGTLLDKPTISYDPVTGKLTIDPGWGFNGLSKNEIATLTIPFSVTDADGDVRTGLYRVTILGSDDPVTSSVGFPETGVITEYAEGHPLANSTGERTWFDNGYNGGGFWINGDQGDTHTVTVVPVGAGQLGHVTHEIGETTANDGAGFVNWKYNVTDQELNYLAAGQTKVEEFDIVVSDPYGNSTTRRITVTLVGSNDTPVITVAQGDSIASELTETNAGLQAAGTLSVSDVDVTDLVTASVGFIEISGPDYGTNLDHEMIRSFMAVNTPVIGNDETTGTLNWSFNSNSQAFNFLPQGSRLVFKYTIVVTDSAGATDEQIVTVAINGTNDGPVVDLNGTGAGIDGTASAVEQLPQWVFESAVLSDVDSQNLQSMTVSFGSRPDGASEVLSLNTAAATAASNAGLTVSIGANGALTIAGSASPAVYQTILRGVVYLNNSDTPTAQRTLEVTVFDGYDTSTAAHMVVSVTPTNDPPQIPDQMAMTVAEGSMTVLSLSMFGFADVKELDPDSPAGDIVFKVPANLPGVTFLNGGVSTLSFTVAELQQGLISVVHDGREDPSVAFTLSVEDANQDGSPADTAQLTINVTQVNDAPQITSPAANATGAATEDGVLVASGQLTATDPDPVDTKTWSVVGNGQGIYGTLAVDSTGKWTYTLDNTDSDLATLNAGQHADETFLVRVTDSAGAFAEQTVTVRVNGANETPPPDARNDSIVTNAANGTLLALPQIALLWNDGSLGGSAYVQSVTPQQNGDTAGVSQGIVTLQVQGSSRLYDYVIGSDGGTDSATVTVLRSPPAAMATGATDDFRVYTDVGALQAFGGLGNDVIVARTGGATQIFGDGVHETAQDGNDLLIGTGGASNHLLGGGGNDMLIGGSINDILDGGSGNDILWGGAGQDSLTGGDGKDVFVFHEVGSTNADTITDYVFADDVIDLSDLLSGVSSDADKIAAVQVDTALNTISVNTGSGWELVATIEPAGVTQVNIKLDDDLSHIFNI